MAEMMRLLKNMFVLLTDVVFENQSMMRAYSDLLYENMTLLRQSKTQRQTIVAEDDSVPMSEVDRVIRGLKWKLEGVQELKRKTKQTERFLLENQFDSDNSNHVDTEVEDGVDSDKENMSMRKKW